MFSPLNVLRGVGEKTAEIYKRLLASRRILEQNKEPKVIDLLYHKPEKIVFRKQNPDLSTVEDGELITVKVVVDSYEKPYRSSQPHRIRCRNSTGFITVVYFKVFPEFMARNFKEGNTVIISGKVEKFNNELQMSHPDYINGGNIPSFEEVYPLTAGLTNRALRQTIQNALPMVPNLPEWLDNNFLFQHQWKSWRDSLVSLHNATTNEQLAGNSPYVERLAFDEILANQIALGIMRERIKANSNKNELVDKSHIYRDYFSKKLPFELTDDQKKVINEIENDIYSDKRMLRLLQGDVGSGKTVVAFLTMLPFIQNRKQVALMVPTSILATQHYEWISKICEGFGRNIEIEINGRRKKTNNVESKIQENSSMINSFEITKSVAKFEYEKEIEIKITKGKKTLNKTVENLKMSADIYDDGTIALNDNNNMLENNAKPILDLKNERPIRVALLTGKVKGKKREKILNDLKNGEIDILVGTHAIFQENVEFKNLGYAIIDEQHRFGVSQRLNLIEKGENIDILIMTATPIPRTLALTIYGDMEVSTIKEKPKNRKDIITSSLQKEKFNELVSRMKEKIKDGEKIYWICPLIEESENLPATPLFQRYEEFKSFFAEDEIGFIHGKLSEDEKDKIMEEFGKKDGSVKILIATTVIEVGIDVPDATIIVIESPERFGLSQMHQLRGRVGRGDKQSYCILFYEKPTENLKKRMDILKSSSNGFFIAEEDLKLRGSGEALGLKQSGYQEYLIANLSEHYNLLLEASKMARYIVKNKDILNSYPIKILLEMFGYGECLNEAILN